MIDSKVVYLITTSISQQTIIDFEIPHKIFAVDGGANYLFKKNIIPEIIFGDLDSIDSEAKEFFLNKTKFLTFEKEKNETDTELALKYCAEHNFNDVIIYNSLSDRFDHTLGLISNLEFALKLGISASIVNNESKVILIEKTFSFRGKIGQIVSLIPISEAVEGISTKGLKYKLQNEVLFRNQTRGISNVLTRNLVEINLTKGRLLIIIVKDV